MSTSQRGARRPAAERLGWASTAALFALLAATAAGEPLAVLDGQAAGGPADRMMVRFLLDQITRETTRHREEILARRDPEAIRRWQAEMRSWFESAIGGLPGRDTPLRAQVTGAVERDGYRVEKVLLESQPGFYVTAALFLPDPARHRGPWPAVLVACGHSTGDFFPIAGTRRSVAVARSVFERLGHPDRIELVETDAEHGWQQPLREATAAWMLRWLCDENRGVQEPPGLRVLSDREIRVTPTGEVLDLEGARSTYDLNAALMTRLRAERQAAWAARSRAAMLGEVRRVTGIRPLADLPAAEPRQAGSEQRPGYRIDRLAIEPEPGIVLPAVAFMPPEAVTAVTIWLDDRGKAHPESVAAIEKRVAAGEAVLAVDLRGLGETRSRDNPWYNPRNGRDAATVALAWMLGRSTVVMRAEDVLVAARVARGLTAGHPPVHLVARGGQAAVPALHAAALERGVFGTVDLTGGPESFEEIVAAPLASDQFVHTVHSALTVYDLPLLRQALTPSE